MWAPTMAWFAGRSRRFVHEEHELTLSALLFAPALLRADAGILIPRDKAQPDPAILSLEEMEITIRVDNGDARVFVKQIFADHTNNMRKETTFSRCPAKLRFRISRYGTGLLAFQRFCSNASGLGHLHSAQTAGHRSRTIADGENAGSEEAKRSSVFSARIVPIQPHGTKRLEIEYHQSIPVEN